MADESRKLDQLVESMHSIEVGQAKIDGKLDVVLATSKDHESRLRVLEQLVPPGLLVDVEALKRFRWALLGAAAVLGGGAGALSQLLK